MNTIGEMHPLSELLFDTVIEHNGKQYAVDNAAHNSEYVVCYHYENGKRTKDEYGRTNDTAIKSDTIVKFIGLLALRVKWKRYDGAYLCCIFSGRKSENIIDNLVCEAKKDSPEVKDENIEVVRFFTEGDGRNFDRKYYMGVEFVIKDGDVLNNYTDAANVQVCPVWMRAVTDRVKYTEWNSYRQREQSESKWMKVLIDRDFLDIEIGRYEALKNQCSVDSGCWNEHAGQIGVLEWLRKELFERDRFNNFEIFHNLKDDFSKGNNIKDALVKRGIIKTKNNGNKTAKAEN